MALNRRLLFTVLVVAVAAAELVGNAAAATYVVGDNLGWTIPTNGPAAYSTWASRHTFRVGDVLVFNFSTGIHDVAEVTKGAFDGCTSTNPIKLVTTGPANITLNSTGANYYICTFASHCSLGQKLAINVSAASASPAPAPGPSPPTPTPTPTPAPTPTPTPSPSPTPTPTPTPSPSPSGAPSPSSAPSPVPSGGGSPPAPASESPPAPVPGSPAGSISPPPPPSSATVASISGPLVIFASVAFGLMI